MEEERLVTHLGIRQVIPLISLVILASCVGESAPPVSGPGSTASSTSTTAVPADTTTSVPSVFDAGRFGELDPVRYWVDPDDDVATPMQVFFTVPGEGWSAWTGAFKDEVEDTNGVVGDLLHLRRYVGVSITVVSNLVRDACLDHTEADPPVGASVDDLADALVNLEPFVVTTPPEDVTAFGYDGVHLELTVPDLVYEPQGEEFFWPECNDGLLKNWIAPILSFAFWGYTSPGQIEEYWILDVEGTRLMIAANRSPDSRPADVAELQAFLDSIEIVP
jgi:hypothetical protein